MDPNSPFNSLKEKQGDIPEEDIANEIDLCISQVKEDIRSTFTRHKKSLAAREIWLLDQLDSIKGSIMKSVFKRQISLAEMRGRLQQSVTFSQFSKDHEFIEGIEEVSKVLDPLCERVKQYLYEQKSSIPSIKFVHEKISLKSAILSYGSLETDFQSTYVDDTDSCSTEYSWDLVDEKSEIEVCDKAKKNRFCVVGTNCHLEKEIEDMDMSKLLAGDDLPPSHSSADMLKSMCKANELCNSISDCVCDTPCLSISSEKSVVSIPTSEDDSVSRLNKKLMAIYQGDDGVEDMIHDSDVLLVSEEHASSDPVLQISASVKNILSVSSCDSCHCSGMGPNRNDFISVLHQKLQSIIDGESDGQLEGQEDMDSDDSSTDRVSYKSLPWEIAAAAPALVKTEGDVVSSLHERLEKIHQQGSDAVIASEFQRQPSIILNSQSDPVQALSSKLQQILAC